MFFNQTASDCNKRLTRDKKFPPHLIPKTVTYWSPRLFRAQTCCERGETRVFFLSRSPHFISLFCSDKKISSADSERPAGREKARKLPPLDRHLGAVQSRATPGNHLELIAKSLLRENEPVRASLCAHKEADVSKGAKRNSTRLPFYRINGLLVLEFLKALYRSGWKCLYRFSSVPSFRG